MKLFKIILGILFILGLVSIALYFWFIQPSYISKPKLTGTFETYSFAYGGINRTYSVYMPKRLDEQLDLIFVLHGSRGKGEDGAEGKGGGGERWAGEESPEEVRVMYC